MITIKTVLPGAARALPIVDAFGRRDNGTVTSISDGRLVFVREMSDEDRIEVLPLGSLISNCLSLVADTHTVQVPKALLREAVASALGRIGADNAFLSTAGFPGLHAEIAGTLDELWSHGWEPEELEQIEGTPRVVQRVRSLAQVMRSVAEILGRLNLEPNAARVRSLLQEQAARGLPFDRVLVLSAHDAEPHHLEFFEWLDRQGVAVTLLAEVHPNNPTMFAGTAGLLERLNARAEPQDYGAFEGSLFGGTTGLPDQEIVLATCADPLSECEWALRDLLGKVKGDRDWRKAGILVRAMDSYGPLLRTAAARLGVPLRMSLRLPLLDNAFVRLTLDSLRFCATGSASAIESLLTSSYLKLGREERAQVRQVVRDNQGSDRLWSRLDDLASDGERWAWLVRLLRARNELASQVLALAEWSRRMTELVGDMPWHEQSLFGSGLTQERDKRAQNVMQRTLAQTASIRLVTDEKPLSFRSFVSLCEIVWDAAETTIPSEGHGVNVIGREEESPQLDHLYVLGVLEGDFPRRRRESPILDDEMRQALAAARSEHAPLKLSTDVVARERDEFYRVCVAPRRSLWLSYPLTGEDRDNIPAFFLQEVDRAAGGVERRDHPRPEIVPLLEQCRAKKDAELARALADPKREPDEPELLVASTRERLRKVPGQGVSPYELRDARVCPFQWFARHRTPIRPPGLRENWFRLRRLPERARLTASLDPETASQDLERALRDMIDRSRSSLEPWEARLLEIGGRRLIAEWVLREFAAREKWPRDVGSVRTGVQFGDRPLKGELPLKPTPVTLEGIVPAVSEYRGAPRIHLFEAKSFGTSNNRHNLDEAAEVFIGIMAFSLGGRPRPSIEIDGFSGRRVLFAIGDTNCKDSPDDGLVVVHISDPKERFNEEVKDGLNLAVERVSTGSIQPIPGEHCKSCGFGEWCRWHLEFGEGDIFGLGKPDDGEEGG